MSELSKQARDLAAQLCGEDYIAENGTVRTGPDYVWTEYDAAKLVEIASAALELAGEKVVFHDDSEGEWLRQRNYRTPELIVSLFQMKGERPAIEVREVILQAEEVGNLALSLLHAARTAREWASEGGNLCT